ncbi:hypothetical protein D3C77_743300 [compost metagenome]
MVPSVLTVPRPAVGWVREVAGTVSGTLPSGSVSLASTLMVNGTPRVATVSGLAVGARLGATLMVTVAGSDFRPLASTAR